jgi:integrase
VQYSQICYPCVTPERFQGILRGAELARALTTKTIEALKADPTKRQEVPDPALSGLYLVLQPSGAKSWALRYRYVGKPAKLTLGRWPLMGLAQARTAATEALEVLAQGSNPSAAKRTAKAAQHEAALSERDKVATLVEQFRNRHLTGLKSGDDAYRFLERFVLPAWGDRDIQTISKRDVIDLLDGIADSGRGVTANRVLAHARKFFNWAVSRDILSAAPTTGVKPPVTEQSRDRVLNDDEIRWLWMACERAREPWGPLARVLLLTGQRLGEVAGMSDREIGDGVWRLAKERTKNRRAHDVPLSQATLDLLSDKTRVAGGAGLVFTTNGTSPVQGYHKGLKRLAETMSEIAAEETGGAVEIPHWTFHDLRRTAATGMARLGIPVRVTEAILNHVSGTGSGIVSVYQRHDYADEKRDALEAWARFVMALAEGDKQGNVVRLGLKS